MFRFRNGNCKFKFANMENRIHLHILKKIRQTSATVTLILEPIGIDLHYEAGQFIALIFNNISGKEFRRSYSFSSTPGVDAFPSITIKKVPNGSATRYLIDHTKPGDTLEAIHPAGQFTVPKSEGTPRDIFLIGGGSGITPLFSILKQVLFFEPQSRVTLILANSNEDAIIFREALREFAKQFSNRFQIIHFLSNTNENIDNLNQIESPAEVRVERMNNMLIEKIVNAQLQFDRAQAQFFLCGPKNLMLKASQILHYLQFSGKQIHQEIFTIVAPYRPPTELYKDSLVIISYQEEAFMIFVKGGQTILEAAEKQDLELPYSCRSGICTACKSRCRNGEVDMYLPGGRITTKSSDNIVFTCVAYPLTERVELEIA